MNRPLLPLCPLADEVSIDFLAVGDEIRAKTITLIGEEVSVGRSEF